MKKIIDLFVLLSVVLLVACSNNEVYPDETVSVKTDYSKEFADLNAQLEVFNQENGGPSLRGWGRWWKIIAADAMGAAVGAGVSGGNAGVAVGLGAYASYQMWNNTGGYQVSYDDGNDAEIAVIINSSDARVDSVGYYHNVILSNLFDEYGDELFTKSRNTIINLICEELSELNTSVTAETISLIKNNSQLNKISAIIDKTKNTDIDDIGLLDKSITYYPELASELNVVKSYFNTIKSIASNEKIESYSNGFAQIVSNSQIPTASVKSINSSLSVAVNSNLLWK
jgi:hypothetical protein